MILCLYKTDWFGGRKKNKCNYRQGQQRLLFLFLFLSIFFLLPKWKLVGAKDKHFHFSQTVKSIIYGQKKTSVNTVG